MKQDFDIYKWCAEYAKGKNFKYKYQKIDAQTNEVVNEYFMVQDIEENQSKVRDAIRTGKELWGYIYIKVPNPNYVPINTNTTYQRKNKRKRRHRIEKIHPITLEVLATYNSVDEVCEKSSDRMKIYSAINDGTEAFGYMWKRVIEPKQPKAYIKGLKYTNIQQIDPITNEVVATYDSLSDITYIINEQNKIRNAIQRGGKTLGYYWRLKDNKQ